MAPVNDQRNFNTDRRRDVSRMPCNFALFMRMWLRRPATSTSVDALDGRGLFTSIGCSSLPLTHAYDRPSSSRVMAEL